MKLIKKNRPGETDKVQYWMYDIVSNDPFYIRTNKLKLKFRESPKMEGSKFKSLVLVDTFKCNAESDLISSHKEFLKENFEGSIVRHGDTGYKIDSRSENLLKYKDFQDIALKIKDIVPAEQRPTWGKPIFELKGKEFSTGTKMSHEDREDLLINKDKYIGKLAEIRYFEMTEDEIPRFGVMVGIRLDK